MKCNECQNENICHDGNHELTRIGCAENDWCCFVPITKADQIRAMTDEEMAKFLAVLSDPKWHIDGNIFDITVPKESSWLSWLKSPVEADNG